MASNYDHALRWNLESPTKRWVDHSNNNRQAPLNCHSTGRLVLLLPLVLIVLSSVGCNSLIDSRVPELIQQRVDPQMGRSYLLYRPSGYDNKRSWPLIVVCHSSFADSPRRQIRAWTELAESKGFLVVAPTLESVSGGLTQRESDLSVRIQNDEAHVLAVVKHVRAGHNVSNDRILIAGHAKGGLVALHVGLRQPNIFRAVAVNQPAFDAQFLNSTSQWIDHYQPVRVHYNAESALWGNQPAECIEWLRQHGCDVREDPLGSSRNADAVVAVQFFERIIREEPWIRIESVRVPDHGPLAHKFSLFTTHLPKSVRWVFGDGDESQVISPMHIYKIPGLYRVTATLQNNSHSLQRTLDVTVP